MVEVRIAAGEALAVLYEIARNFNDGFRFSNHAYLEEQLSKLALDSVKHHAKRDKKLQKLSFRQIIDAIFNDKRPHIQVHFNKRETLQVEGCLQKLVYDNLCQLLKVN